MTGIVTAFGGLEAAALSNQLAFGAAQARRSQLPRTDPRELGRDRHRGRLLAHLVTTRRGVVRQALSPAARRGFVMFKSADA